MTKIIEVEFSLLDYLALVEALGQSVRPNKRGVISSGKPPLLEWLGMGTEEWLKFSKSFGVRFRCAVGTIEELASYASHTNRAWVAGQRIAAIPL